jgi:hypothetical protein
MNRELALNNMDDGMSLQFADTLARI